MDTSDNLTALLQASRSTEMATVDTGEPSSFSSSQPILTIPYPIRLCGPEVAAQYPKQLGLFVAGRQKNYAFRANRMSIELAVSHLGYQIYPYLPCAPVNSPTPDMDEDVAADQLGEAAALQTLASALQADAAQTRMSFVFMKPRLLPWECLDNSLTFEPYHPPSLFAADKWNMTEILRRRANLPTLFMRDAIGEPFDYRRFTLYTANPARNQKVMLKYLDENPGVYVLKRTNSSQGIGIRFFAAQAPNTLEKLQRCAGPDARLSRFVLQKYIERPLLIDKRKFDLRVYLLILSCSTSLRPQDRSYFAFCHPGYVKVSSRAYSQDSRDPRVHFTNQFVQRRVPTHYEKVKEATTWLPDELNAYLERKGRTVAGWCRWRMYRQVQAICGYLAAACRPYLESRRPGCVFRIYGPDLIVDENLRVRLLEFNCFPCYAKNTIALSASVTGMWREAVAVATETALRYRERRPVSRGLLATERNFCLVHSSEKPNVLVDLVRSCYP